MVILSPNDYGPTRGSCSHHVTIAPKDVFSGMNKLLNEAASIELKDLKITPPERKRPKPRSEKEKEQEQEDRLNYITNPDVRRTVEDLLSEIKSWDEARILIEPTKDDLSLKISGRVFSYIHPRRKHFIVSTYDNEEKWTGFPINQEEDLEPVRVLLKANIERLG